MNLWSDIMEGLLDQINQSNLEILCILVAIVAILLAVIVIGDFIISKVKYNNRKIVVHKVVRETPKEEEKLNKTSPIR